MTPNLVSVIIPTYNRSQLLVEAVESCLNQTYSNIEIIIIDDGSLDNTEKQINYFLQNDWSNKNFIYIKQNNAGASAARNLGIKESKGEYIQFLDSDDLLFPGKIEQQLKALQDNDSIVCSCYGLIGKSLRSETKRLGESFHSVTDLINKLISNKVHIMSTPAPLWKASFIKSQQGWREDISFGDDLEYHIRLLSKATNACFVDKELFFVREHEEERLSEVLHDETKIYSSIKTRQSIYDVLSSNGLWSKEIQKNYLSGIRTTYANVLTLCENKVMKNFEELLLTVSKSPKYNVIWPFLVFSRKILGRKFILKTHQFVKKAMS